MTFGVDVAIVARCTVLAVESGRVIGAVGTVTGHVITGARSPVALAWQTTTAIVLPSADSM